MKTCTKCLIEKSFSEFVKDKRARWGVGSECRSCFNSRSGSLKKTERGCISKIYRSQVNHSKKRGHQPPKYTKDQLTEWLHLNGFSELFNKWKLSGYLKSEAPSCDRHDDSKGYSLCNIQLVTWKENHAKLRKPVNQLTLSGELIARHDSITAAGITVSVKPINITSTITGKQKTSGGYRWAYA